MRDAKLNSGHRFKRHRRGYMCYVGDDTAADDDHEEFEQSKRTEYSGLYFSSRKQNAIFCENRPHMCTIAVRCSGAEPLVWHR